LGPRTIKESGGGECKKKLPSEGAQKGVIFKQGCPRKAVWVGDGEVKGSGKVKTWGVSFAFAARSQI